MAPPTDRPVFHFFYSQSHGSRLQAIHLFESYAKQMISYFEITKQNYPPQVKQRVKKYYGPKGQKPIIDDLLDDIIFPLSRVISPTTFMVDGLDECEPSEFYKVFKALRKLVQSGVHKIFVSGRKILEVGNSIEGSIELPILSTDTIDDIRRLIDWKIDEKMRERRLTESQDMLDEVKRRLNDKADRM
jgi:hypothetical protein